MPGLKKQNNNNNNTTLANVCYWRVQSDVIQITLHTPKTHQTLRFVVRCSYTRLTVLWTPFAIWKPDNMIQYVLFSNLHLPTTILWSRAFAGPSSATTRALLAPFRVRTDCFEISPRQVPFSKFLLPPSAQIFCLECTRSSAT